MSIADDRTSAEPVQQPASWRARLSWAMFDWANQPYFTVITTFIFAPYFTSKVIGDPLARNVTSGRPMRRPTTVHRSGKRCPVASCFLCA